TGYRPGSCITQWTNSITFYLLGHINQQINIRLLSFAIFNAVQYSFHPTCTLAAWRTLAATFMMIEPGKIPGVTYDTLGFVKYNKTARTQHGTGNKSAI